jgi:two-component system capsular synthesis response regulator RcsB
MFKKIIVAEDIDSISHGLKVIFSKYCDETFLKIKRAKQDKNPFDLLITDLSFKSSHMDVKLISGEQLIKQLKTEEVEIAIIAYSIDERGYNIRYLLDDLDINGYVSKGRESTQDLLKAIQAVYNGEKYVSPHLAHLKKPDGITDLDTTDLEIIKLLAEGFSQPEIVNIFKKQSKKSSSFSSVEKRIIKMRTSLQAKNTTQLVGIAKDMGLV